MTHTLPKLNYKYDSLEPYIDTKTMEIHYTKHHQAYIDKLNAAVQGTKLEKEPVENLLMDLKKIPDNLRIAIQNHGGGHFNHSFFWQILKKDIKPQGDVIKAIEKTFGSLEKFKEQFSQAALGRFGSGWAWLVSNKGKLEITTTLNQDCPISENKYPLLGLDLWEHSYYIKHMWNRTAYIQDFFQVINWKQVEENYKKAKK